MKKLQIPDQAAKYLSTTFAEVMKLVDMHVSGTCAFGRAGSTPAFGTNFLKVKIRPGSLFEYRVCFWEDILFENRSRRNGRAV